MVEAANRSLLGAAPDGMPSPDIAPPQVARSCDPFADNNKVVNNTITDPEADGQIGVFVGTGDAAGGFTPTASNNKVINNEIAGYVSPIEEDGDGTKIHANKEPAQ